MRRVPAALLIAIACCLLVGGSLFAPLATGEVGIVMTAGRAVTARAGPGIIFRIPFRDRLVRVSPERSPREIGVGVEGAGTLALRLWADPDPAASFSALAVLAEAGVTPALDAGVEVTRAAVRERGNRVWTRADAENLVRSTLTAALSRHGLRLGRVEFVSAAPATLPARSDSGARVLLVGIDSADWGAIEPLLAAGKLPTIARLRAEGAWGVLRGDAPLLSPLLWTTAATGKPPDEHGIADFVMLDPATGAASPISSRFRRVKAFWNILSDAGLSVSVVGWWATWPAEPIEGVMVTERVAYSLFAFDTGEVRDGLVYPPSYAETVAALRVPAEAISREDLRPFARLTGADWERSEQALARGGDEAFLEPVSSLRQTLAATRTYHRVALDLLHRGAPRTLAVYYQGLDEVNHRFAHLVGPRHPLATPAERERFGSVVDAFYELQDRLLGELLEAAPADTELFVLSDHGFAQGAERPRGTLPFIEAGRPGRWHTPDGIWILHGPRARAGRLPGVARMDQVTPTLLRILGLPLAADMHGAPLEAALAESFLRGAPRAEIASYDPVAAPAAERGEESPSSTSPAADDPLLAKLRSLGYLSPGEGGGEGPMPAAGGTSANYHANLGISLMSRRDYRRAREEFRRTLEMSPQHLGARGGILQMDIEEGRYAAALDDTLSILAETRDFDPVFYYVAAQLYVRSGRAAAGLERFHAMVVEQPAVPQVRTGLGVLLQAAGDLEGARSAFRTSLDLKPDALYALQELYALETPAGDLRGLLRRCDAAAELVPQSILPYNWAALVLRRLGRPAEAEDRLRQALAADPGSSLTLVNLSSLLVDTGRAEQAIPFLEEVLRTDPDRTEARVNLIVALGQLRRLPEARKLFTAAGGNALSATPELLNAMAFACYLNGAVAEARPLLQQSLTRRPDQAEARRLLARIDAAPPAG